MESVSSMSVLRTLEAILKLCRQVQEKEKMAKKRSTSEQMSILSHLLAS